MKILHLDKNHPLLIEELTNAGFENDENYYAPKEAIEQIIHQYDGIVLRSRFKIDKTFLDAASNLKFIGRVGAGLENIDCEYAQQKGIQLIAAPEGNRTAVAEHAMGMLLNLTNKLNYVNNEISNGIWKREENRGIELEGKTVGIIGYGVMGKAFAQRLKGFNCTVLCYDILPHVGDGNAQQVSLQELQQRVDVLSLHTPETPETHHLINKPMIDGFLKSFWFINTARGKSVNTDDLVDALKSGKVKGAGLDVLEYEKTSFENMFSDNELPESFRYLINAENVLLSPHIAGWTIESKEKLAQIIAQKIIRIFKPKSSNAMEENNNVENGNQVPQNNPQQPPVQQNNPYGNQQNQYQQAYQQQPAYIQEANSKKILAGILAIILGHIGVHKFVLGYNTEGIILLTLGIAGYVTACFVIGYFILFATGIIGLVEGIIYLTKSDEDFYNTYMRNRKPWF
ncbi:NINE protein [Flavobacterium sp. xlx-214]|nr:NINE protein [Flavobacterium sp. xlx-221]QMI84123.1 NINE protein [Flavobacterium sp. xlx-214]